MKYKNRELIWRIAPALNDEGIDIYVAGSTEVDALRFMGEPMPLNLRFLGRLTDDELAATFKNALCFLFPSRIEGFGLPLVEAMACGCPVVASNSPCLPEIGGDAALYCDPDDADGWIAQILQLRHNSRLQNSLKLRGFERAKLYSWEKVAQIYLQLMAEIDEDTCFT